MPTYRSVGTPSLGKQIKESIRRMQEGNIADLISQKSQADPHESGWTKR